MPSILKRASFRASHSRMSWGRVVKRCVRVGARYLERALPVVVERTSDPMGSRTRFRVSARTFFKARTGLLRAAAIALCLPASAGNAVAMERLEFLSDFSLEAQARYRFEHVDQDGFDKNALASTMRLQASVETPEVAGISVLVEGAGTAIAGSDTFNSTDNGRLDRPVVADPDHIELNRAQLTADLDPRFKLTVGRQKIELGDERFVGDDGFRQDDQTFDAVRIDSTFAYGQVNSTLVAGNRVNRIFGRDNALAEFTGGYVLSNATVALTDTIEVTGYGHWLDLDEAPALSTRTIGGRIEGKHDVGSGVALGWTGEYAFQQETADNPRDLDLFYAKGQGDVQTVVGTFSTGVEVLSGDGRQGFSTPLATLHQFNGRADAFVVTPAEGLRDIHLGFRTSLPGIGPAKALRANLKLHKFDSDDGTSDFGREVDARIQAKFSRHVASSLAYARYVSGDDPTSPTDRSKLWFMLDLKL